MRRDDDVRRLQQRPGVRLGREDVDRRAGDLSRLERGDERGLVDQLAAGGVDDPDAVAHVRDRAGVDRVPRVVGQRQMQRQELGALEHLVRTSRARRRARGSAPRTRTGRRRPPSSRSASARRATCRPMRPKPSTPSTLSASSTPAPLRPLPPAPRTSAECACGMFPGRVRAAARPYARRPRRRWDWGAFAETTIPQTRRRIDVDVVHPHARASDHLEVGARRDQLGSGPWSPTGRSGVVVADDLLKRRALVYVDVEPTAAARTPASAIGSRTRTLAVGRMGSNASNALGTAAPRSISAPSSLSDSSTAASALAMSNMSNQPMWPMRKTLPFQLPLARARA